MVPQNIKNCKSWQEFRRMKYENPKLALAECENTLQILVSFDKTYCQFG